MNPSRHERDLLNRYLLGYLTEEEREQVGSRLFTDDNFAEALEDAERDLLDDYAHSKLNEADRAAVTSRLVASESQHEKLRFAQALARRSKARKGPATPRFLLVAAAILVVLGASWLWLQRTPQTPAATAISPSAPETTVPPPEPAPVFAALLAPGAVRGEDDIQQVSLPLHAKSIRFDLQLQNTSNSTTYSIKVMRQRDTLAEQTGLTPHLEGDTSVLSLVLRSAILSPGNYRIALTSQSESQSYYFRIR